MKKITYAKYALGQLVEHKFMEYRGLIVDLDAEFDEGVMAATNVEAPTENIHMPWYHILVEGERYAAYIAEDNLQPAQAKASGQFDHPVLSDFFHKSSNNSMSARHRLN